MRFYAIQTKLTMDEVHEKLGFKNWHDYIKQDFDENEDGIYMMSIHRIENKSLSDFSDDELLQEIKERGL